MPRIRTLGFVQPMQALAVACLPEGPDWSYEIKLDGYRAQVICDKHRVQLLSRNGLDLGHRFPALCTALNDALPTGSVVDGELVALNQEGKPSFNLLQNFASGSAPIVFYAFDLMAVEGRDLTSEPLIERRRLLSAGLLPSRRFSCRKASTFPPTACSPWCGNMAWRVWSLSDSVLAMSRDAGPERG